MIDYTPPLDIKWPEKDEKRLADHQKMQPMWSEDTSKWEKYLTLTKRREYMFQYDWIAYIPYLGAYALVRAGFVHDWASIPSVLKCISSPDGVLAPFAPFHDFGYCFKGLYLALDAYEPFKFVSMTRKELDVAFKMVNTWHNDLPAIHNPAHVALRWFGGLNYGQLDIKTVDWSKPVNSTTGK